MLEGIHTLTCLMQGTAQSASNGAKVHLYFECPLGQRLLVSGRQTDRQRFHIFSTAQMCQGTVLDPTA